MKLSLKISLSLATLFACLSIIFTLITDPHNLSALSLVIAMFFGLCALFDSWYPAGKGDE